MKRSNNFFYLIYEKEKSLLTTPSIIKYGGKHLKYQNMWITSQRLC